MIYSNFLSSLEHLPVKQLLGLTVDVIFHFYCMTLETVTAAGTPQSQVCSRIECPPNLVITMISSIHMYGIQDAIHPAFRQKPSPKVDRGPFGKQVLDAWHWHPVVQDSSTQQQSNCTDVRSGAPNQQAYNQQDTNPIWLCIYIHIYMCTDIYIYI